MLVTRFIAAAAVSLLLGSAVAVADSVEGANALTADDTTQEVDTLIYSVRLRMPYGYSVWTAELDKTWSANPVKLRFLPEPSCRAPRMALYLRSTSDGLWTRTVPNGDVDLHTLASFDGVRFDIEQSYLLDQVCEFFLYAADAGSTPPPPPPPGPVWGTGVLSGGAEYTGGFATGLEVNISAATRIKGFRLAIPEFCQGVEVLEAGTVTEGNFDPATLVDAEKNLYQVASGSVRASRIVFSMNGPFDARCFVPVYTYTAE